MLADPLLGRVIAGRYRLDALLGEGQMARVYVAEQLSMGRKIAVKILRHELLSEAEAPARFRREVAAVTQLRSPHAIQFFDFGETDDRLLFIAMELLDGETLRDRLERDRVISPDETLAIVRQIAAALDEAHRAGVVHRDLKPENIHLSARPGDAVPFVKVLDFGLAKLLHAAIDGSPALTAPNTTVGSPAYVAPEMVVVGRVPDWRSDLYALAVITYEMLVGERPFQGATPIEMILEHARAPIPSACARNPDLPPAIDALMSAGLAKEPAARPADAFTFAHALAAALGAWLPD
jgi:serine/threonine-protein kinase